MESVRSIRRQAQSLFNSQPSRVHHRKSQKVVIPLLEAKPTEFVPIPHGILRFSLLKIFAVWPADVFVGWVEYSSLGVHTPLRFPNALNGGLVAYAGSARQIRPGKRGESGRTRG